METDSVQNREYKLRIVVFGGFKLLAPDNSDVSPRSAKARALLALLALAPDLKRSRNWLRDKLWSRQEDIQSSASLRQALSIIRKSLGSHQSALITKLGMVSLDPARVEVLLTPQIDVGEPFSTFSNRAELLEGLEINDPEFDDWLQEQRLGLEIKKLTEEPIPASEPPQAAAKTLKFLLKDVDCDPGTLLGFSEMVKDSVSKRVAEAASVEIHPVQLLGKERRHSRTDIILHSHAFGGEDQQNLRIRLESAFDGRTLWAGVRTLNEGKKNGFNTVSFQQLMNQAVDRAVQEYTKLASAHARRDLPAIMCFDAVRKMFQLGSDNVEEADRLLQNAYEIEPEGIYLGWRAYLRIIQLGERLKNDRLGAIEEANMFVRHALEKDPSNSLVLALASYVQTMLFRNYETAFELARESLDNCRINPLGWAFMGIARMHLGQTELAHNNTLHARNISGPGPHKYQLDMLACQTAAVSGRFEDAIKFGQSTRALAPGYAPPLRYLSALMINAGREEQAEEVLGDLRKIEPNFSFDLMLDTAYPSAALRKSPLTKGLRDRMGKG